MTEYEFTGVLARVTVPILAGQPGKIRTQVKGDIIDFVALSEGGTTIERGEEVYITGIEGGTARVARQNELLGE